ncbi:hypothetical protein KUTeg_012645 [Tegillarca granosa]|uniref:Ankyrin repeat domain-containing protein 39 n=1 Tax=Tegillarca granosa TaxID=220873 RepID=A0ABQ9F3P5_TEGGR|nr:hypothetical protein KUTeg_012645 [Tegillarca granosa]
MSKCSDGTHVCSGHLTSSSVHQTLDELDFERGIWTAALNGDLLDVKKHLDRNSDCDLRDSSGYTALHYSSRNGHKDICELLLERGANPNAITNSGGVTSLHRASYKGHEDIVKLLLKHGADPKIQDRDGKTVLHKVRYIFIYLSILSQKIP